MRRWDPVRPPVYVPWPVAMEIADACERNGFLQLARDARQIVWDEALRRWNAASLSGSDTGEGTSDG